MNMNPADAGGLAGWYRGFIQGKTRIAMAWIFSILLILTARSFPIWPGIAVCFIGAALRFWASGYLRKDSRPAVGGPYAMTRNPLYVGTYLMALGTAIAIQNWWLLALITVLYAAIYHYIILDEETKLRRIFGEPYLEYCKRVPRFFPRPWPVSSEALLVVNPVKEQHGFDWQIAKKNRAHEPFAAFAAIIGFTYLLAWFWQSL